jgi:hypothetical protein
MLDRLLYITLFLLISNVAMSKPVVLHCSDTDDLYALPYTVILDANALTITIIRTGDLMPTEKQQYRIENVQNENGEFSLTASNSLLNSHINVIASGDKQIIYTDFLTNRPMAVDRCK